MWKISFKPLNISIILNNDNSFPTKNEILDFLEHSNFSDLEKLYVKKCMFTLKQPWIITNNKFMQFECINDLGLITIFATKE